MIAQLTTEQNNWPGREPELNLSPSLYKGQHGQIVILLQNKLQQLEI